MKIDEITIQPEPVDEDRLESDPGKQSRLSKPIRVLHRFEIGYACSAVWLAAKLTLATSTSW
jgi:hypothetical protein